MRLPRTEVGKATGKRTVSLLLDLQNFYDHVDLETPLDQWEALNFPPAVMNMVMERYTGLRTLQGGSPAARPPR